MDVCMYTCTMDRRMEGSWQRTDGPTDHRVVCYINKDKQILYGYYIQKSRVELSM